MGCFAKGCLVLMVVVVVLGVVLIGSGLFVVNRGINMFTATEPAQIQTRPVTATGIAAGESKIGLAPQCDQKSGRNHN